MQRRASTTRPDWQKTIEQQGLVYWRTDLPSGEQISYWNEEYYYSFRLKEITEMERVARELLELLVAAGDHVIEHDLFAKLGIPEFAAQRIRETWESEPPMLYGRFDFAYSGGDIKLLEYNADTPTCLIETAVQWHWMRDLFGDEADQWNRVHEALVERWTELRTEHRLPDGEVHFLHSHAEKSGEDFMTVAYLLNTAKEAGLKATLQPIEELGWSAERGFADTDERPVQTAFKLYPWEWMLNEEFAQNAIDRMGVGPGLTQWIEPIWKLLWANKGILAILWELNPGHPNLVPAWFAGEEPKELADYVTKPIFAREGANTSIVLGGEVVESGPDESYGSEGYVVQEYVDLGNYAGHRPVLGVWTVDMEPVGLGIRESTGYITNNQSRFVPHMIEG
jgi:glutathionylspermidine synthase